MFSKQLLDSTRGRIVAALRAGVLTAEDLASRLGLTRSAIRAHLTSMERDGVVRRRGQRSGPTRPAVLFELTSDVEQLLSGAYIPLLTQLVDVFVDALPPGQQEVLLRQTGRRLAVELLGGRPPAGNLAARTAAASELLNLRLGALTRVERNGRFVIRGVGCPVAALSGKHRGVCVAMESFVAEIVRAPVEECCDRTDRPQCCFKIGGRSRVPTASSGNA